MKLTLILATTTLVFAFSTKAQVQSGKVIYEETLKMDIKLDGENAQFANMFPKEHKTRHELYFTPEAAFFQAVPKEVQKEEKLRPSEHPSGGMVIMNVQMDASDDKIYTGLSEGKSVAQRSFMGRQFLVTGDIKKAAWKMTGNQKTILDYPCQEAIMINDKDTTVAWFTTAIPVSAGPNGWAGLPGLILAAYRNSNISINALSVTPGPVEDGIIVQPKSGKKVTNEEFKAIVAAKKKEMGAEGPGGGQIIMRIKEN